MNFVIIWPVTPYNMAENYRLRGNVVSSCFFSNTETDFSLKPFSYCASDMKL